MISTFIFILIFILIFVFIFIIFKSMAWRGVFVYLLHYSAVSVSTSKLFTFSQVDTVKMENLHFNFNRGLKAKGSIFKVDNGRNKGGKERSKKCNF